MSAWTITLLLAAPATRTIPEGNKLHHFPAGKSFHGCSDFVADRCKTINELQGETFEVKEEAPKQPQIQQPTIQPVAVEQTPVAVTPVAPTKKPVIVKPKPKLNLKPKPKTSKK